MHCTGSLHLESLLSRPSARLNSDQLRSQNFINFQIANYAFKSRLASTRAPLLLALLRHLADYIDLCMCVVMFNSETVPFISTTAHSKLLFRAVQADDAKLLRQLINDRKQIAKVFINHV